MEATDAIGTLSALAQPTRLDAFRRLAEAEPRGLSAGELAKALGVPANTLSAHAAILARAGLVAFEKKGRVVTYRALPARVDALSAYLLAQCCGGQPGACRASPEPIKPRDDGS